MGIRQQLRLPTRTAQPLTSLPCPRKTRAPSRLEAVAAIAGTEPASSSPTMPLPLMAPSEKLLSPPETSRDFRSPPPLPPRLREIPQPQQHRGPERGVPAPRAPCHPPWLSPGRPPRSPDPALHPLALPSPLWGDSGVTGKKVKGAGGGGWGKGFF
uniref:cDNA FLJ45584 fis, clone BRTHA3013860 n=1 Tax=Homo sapiens TaxID=9606 RepID=Q6ZSE9_HUMAN|nr:unnamed protein product [Homo sapiens]